MEDIHKVPLQDDGLTDQQLAYKKKMRKLEEQEKQLKAKRRKLMVQRSQEKRKERARRLIKLGEIVETHLGILDSEEEQARFAQDIMIIQALRWFRHFDRIKDEGWEEQPDLSKSQNIQGCK